MASFKYEAVAGNGKAVNGVVEAYDKFEAIDKIKQTYSIVSSLKEVDERNGLLDITIGTPKISEKALSLMCSQFSIIIKSGMPIVRCVELIAEQTTGKYLKRILEKVEEDVAQGFSLAQSFENKGGSMLPVTFIETIRAGEESGSLETAFDRLCTYFENSARTKGKVKSAMTYPITLIIIAVIVVAVIMIFAMPAFIGVFEGSGRDLPGPTKALIAMSHFFQTKWYILLAIIAIGVIAFQAYNKTVTGHLNLAKLRLGLPIIGNISRMNGSAQFANTMSTMLAAGLSVVRSVEICSRVLDNAYLGTCLSTAVGGLEEGKPLGHCIEQAQIFPKLLVEMTSVGDETGSLESTLETIGEYFGAETETATSKALALLQPIITVIIGIFVGFIVIAIYLPMFSMYG